VLDHPSVRRQDVVDGGRKTVLWCQPVVDGDDAYPGAFGEEPAHGVVVVEVAVDEAAAVDVQQRRRRRGGIARRVEPQHQFARWSCDGTVGDRAHRRAAADHPGACDEGTAATADRQRGEVRPLEVLQLEDELHLRVEGLAVDDDGSAGQYAQDAERQPEQCPHRAAFDVFEGAAEQQVHHGDQDTVSI